MSIVIKCLAHADSLLYLLQQITENQEDYQDAPHGQETLVAALIESSQSQLGEAIGILGKMQEAA